MRMKTREYDTPASEFVEYAAKQWNLDSRLPPRLLTQCSGRSHQPVRRLKASFIA
jgi:hypothetical protein